MLFKPVLEIKSSAGELHFRRWKILSTKWFNIYLHKLYKSDKDLYLHDHPWNYVSWILQGSLLEKNIEMGEKINA